VAFVLLCGASAMAAATPAGTLISNIARIDYRLDGGVVSRQSNQVDIRVGELIDFTVAPAPTCTAPSASGLIVVGFDIFNRGNGREAFVPGQPVITGTPSFVLTGVFADTNLSGCYEAGIDLPILPGGRTDPVPPGGWLRIFVIGGGDAGGGHITLPITSGTGGGGTGTAYLGAGDDGGDAVIGASGGTVGDIAAPLPSPLIATLVKSQSVRAADGSTQPRYGAIVTYSIEGRFAGLGTARAAAIADLIPAGTDYVPGSITLDGRPISDAAGDDAGGFDGRRIAVSLGDVAAPAMHSVSFKVRIK
jgi:uncharacterized repeat protein (TIGR01451 family)